MISHMYCECKDELTPHDYVVHDWSGEEGYRCRYCRSIKLIEDEA